jgi:hypothetical protein
MTPPGVAVSNHRYLPSSETRVNAVNYTCADKKSWRVKARPVCPSKPSSNDRISDKNPEKNY